MISKELIRRVPKVDLHNHLDGGLRPSTIIDLAQKYGVELPTEPDPEKLKEWFTRGCRQKNLVLYLETFDVTIAVMQTEEALERVAFELAEDMSAENIVYSEVRYAPLQHTAGGLTPDQVVKAVTKGLERARKKYGIVCKSILCAMRHESAEKAQQVAELAVAYRDKGVVGFDTAGGESGNPPKKFINAYNYIRKMNFNITIHAGEAYGPESMWQAIQLCGAHRIGHGTKLIEDMDVDGMRIVKMGSLASYVLDKRIPLEMCLSSNVDTGASASIAAHPFQLFFRNGFRVFLCTDNRLMSDTTMTREMELAAEYYSLDLKDLEKITLNAMKSSFIHHDELLTIIYDVIKTGYNRIRFEYGIRD